jgi:hypothetical protein
MPSTYKQWVCRSAFKRGIFSLFFSHAVTFSDFAYSYIASLSIVDLNKCKETRISGQWYISRTTSKFSSWHECRRNFALFLNPLLHQLPFCKANVLAYKAEVCLHAQWPRHIYLLYSDSWNILLLAVKYTGLFSRNLNCLHAGSRHNGSCSNLISPEMYNYMDSFLIVGRNSFKNDFYSSQQNSPAVFWSWMKT